MGKISTYAIDGTPTVTDKVIGTDVGDSNITKNYTISDILGLATANTLQAVLDTGNTSTTPFDMTTGSSYSQADNLKLKTGGDLTLDGTLTDSVGTTNDGTKVLGSDALGLPLWVTASSPSIAQVLHAPSTSNQSPGGLDTVLQVSFGSGTGTGVDPAMVSAIGDITFNDVGVYFVNAVGYLSRVGSSGGVSTMLFRSLVDGSQVNSIGAVSLPTVGVTIPETLSFPIRISTPGTVLTFEILRDSSGVDQGGLYPTTTISSWDNAPSSALTIWKLF
tara:strand:+ start:802 stop:1629 length:828 start_codon:yes stop_codon:yes gene_type:complete